jgi:hypothetical protein
MGCTNSKIDRDDAVARCKARKRFMRQAVDSRHAFAASHAHYVIALKSVGSALRQFAEGEVKDPAAAVIPSDGPSTALVALAPSPLPKPPPPPPMSPSLLSPSLPPSPPPLPPPLSPPHIELHGPRNTTLFKSPELVREADNEEPSSPPPPPLITPIGYDDDWSSSVQAPPSRQGQYLPRPPISYSSWHDLFMDPFRLGPHSDQGYMLSNQNSEHSQPAETYENKLPQVEEEDDIPDLEDVDTDGPASKVVYLLCFSYLVSSFFFPLGHLLLVMQL